MSGDLVSRPKKHNESMLSSPVRIYSWLSSLSTFRRKLCMLLERPSTSIMEESIRTQSQVIEMGEHTVYGAINTSCATTQHLLTREHATRI
jgi:hypothetical protein